MRISGGSGGSLRGLQALQRVRWCRFAGDVSPPPHVSSTHSAFRLLLSACRTWTESVVVGNVPFFRKTLVASLWTLGHQLRCSHGSNPTCPPPPEGLARQPKFLKSKLPNPTPATLRVFGDVRWEISWSGPPRPFGQGAGGDEPAAKGVWTEFPPKEYLKGQMFIGASCRKTFGPFRKFCFFPAHYIGKKFKFETFKNQNINTAILSK